MPLKYVNHENTVVNAKKWTKITAHSVGNGENTESKVVSYNKCQLLRMRKEEFILTPNR